MSNHIDNKKKRTVTKKTIGTVILTGGRSSRMGMDKANLKIAGCTFIEKLASELFFIEERLLSVNQAQKRHLPGFTNVVDEVDAIGPIGGICTALKHCKSDALLVVACDMPFFTKECAKELIVQFQEEPFRDVCVLITKRDEQPLAAIYAKTALPVIEEQIRRNDYRMRNLLAVLDTKRFLWNRECEIININTLQDFKYSVNFINL